MTEEHRDDELSRLLDDLRAPDHRDGFWADVRAELDGAEAEAAPTAASSPAAATDGSRAGGNHTEGDDAVSLDAHRARRRLPVRPALVAAAVVLIGLLGVGVALHEDGDDSVGVTTNPTAVTGPNVLTAPTGPLRAAGDPVELGAGRVVGVDPTGTFVYLADAAPDGGMGCEGSPAQSLFVQRADGGDRAVALPAALGDATGGIEIRFGPQGEVAVMTQCEGYGAAVVTGALADDGTITDPVELTIRDLDLGRPVDSILDVEFRSAGTLVATTYTVGPDGSEHRHLYELPTASGEVVDLGPTDVIHLDVTADGRVATSSADGTIRLDGAVVAQIPGVVGLSVSPSGRQIVVVTGDRDGLIAVDTTSGTQTVLSQARGGRGVATAIAAEAVSDGLVVATVGDESGGWHVISVAFDGAAPAIGLDLPVSAPTEVALPADLSRLYVTVPGGAGDGTSVVAQDLTR